MKILTFAVLGVLAVGTPAFALGAAAAIPMKITSCVVARDDSKSDSSPGAASTNGVTLVVMNTALKPIANIRISGVYNGTTVTDTFAGPFEPGKSYTLHKTHTPMVYDGPNASCVLKHVAFVDGTSWQMAMPAMKQ